jgi:DNA primase
MPGIDLRQVRREISIQQVLDLLDFVPTTRQGPRLRGPCPIHSECRPNSRVFSVHLGCDRYRCFCCHAAGTQLDLWAAVHGLTIFTAAADLCRHLGIAIPHLPATRVNQRPGK